ncbi:proteasome inhibitor PI31 subunit [Diorhabda sublineata]|uniref:proteasome inhibitor PI31 subunit n=1 Tax=Diorhabda sublineata TaxID=1163346 RepID=UPI0024E0EB87|nr:proteasome inhibitor PI31 subunit [Diorhabda sublineata]
MAESVFGWDLLYNSVEKDIKNNQDILICLTHLVLVSNGFRCIGLGESKIIDGDEPKSESLPKNWNENYSIRYVYQGKLYILKATHLDDAVMINLIRIDERTVSFVQLNTRSVASRSGPLSEMIPNHKDIVEQIRTQLISKVIVSSKTKENASQTENPGRSRSDARQQDDHLRRFPPTQPIVPVIPVIPNINPGNYGRSDLDPLGGIGPLGFPAAGGGGMLFRPPGPSFGGGFGGVVPGGNVGLPPGAVPPGARFDPFRPPDPDRFPPRRPNRPDNDEFPPPGYDDMFM